jgi:23S rRNA (pseudouridine1915-N3)-methyltransferase
LTGDFALVKVKLIVVGKTKEDWIKEGIKHYLKLLKKYVDLEIVEVKEEKITKSKDEKSILDSEGERIAKYLEKNALWIALDIDGEKFTSEEFAKLFEKSLNRGYSNFALIIGGALGLSKKILGGCLIRLSLSRMTFPHELSRIIILEQIYRAFSILAGTKYHK